jgi:hypothetical protein
LDEFHVGLVLKVRDYGETPAPKLRISGHQAIGMGERLARAGAFFGELAAGNLREADQRNAHMERSARSIAAWFHHDWPKG